MQILKIKEENETESLLEEVKIPKSLLEEVKKIPKRKH